VIGQDKEGTGRHQMVLSRTIHRNLLGDREDVSSIEEAGRAALKSTSSFPRGMGLSLSTMPAFRRVQSILENSHRHDWSDVFQSNPSL